MSETVLLHGGIIFRSSGSYYHQNLTEFGGTMRYYLLQNAKHNFMDKRLIPENNLLCKTKKGKFFTDGIATDLFYLNLEE